MSDDESSALFRKASRSAEEFDRTEKSERTKLAAVGTFGWMLLSALEGLLRDQLLLVTVASSIFVAIFALMATSWIWTPVCLGVGLVSIALMRVALVRRWTAGLQWIAAFAALAANGLAFFALWKYGNI
ncbi:hypothetical protein ACWEPH_27820 [Nocardia beijingensis]|uniref:hypothetical protein n=1 Tax=Nocardia beijingensis TaxID=95162 RepID=UPI00189382B8|nr:hypothetical protein [Nocardia beijingensis]MBF6075812.1 hypothetical protein [Nocardia beijingensis]